MAKLTPRQREIARLLAAGYSQKETARKLGVRYGTVRKHTQSMRERTQCRSTTALVARVIAGA